MWSSWSDVVGPRSECRWWTINPLSAFMTPIKVRPRPQRGVTGISANIVSSKAMRDLIVKGSSSERASSTSSSHTVYTVPIPNHQKQSNYPNITVLRDTLSTIDDITTIRRHSRVVNAFPDEPETSQIQCWKPNPLKTQYVFSRIGEQLLMILST